MALTQISTQGIKDGTITNADIGSSAAIAGSKINPNFGSQNIETMGNASIRNILTISGSGPSLTLTDIDNNPDYRLQNDNGKFRVLDYTNSADRLLIDTSGNVGIGTSTIGEKLTIGDGDLKFFNSDAANNHRTTFIEFQNSSNRITSESNFGSDGSSGYAAGYKFSTKNYTGSAFETLTPFVIQANGNVGINNTTPAAALYVNDSSSDNPAIFDTGNGNGAHIRFKQIGSTKHYLGCGGGISMGNANQLSMRSTDNIHFATGNSSTIRASFLNGGGLSFNGDTAAANALDDYEEGTWTASVNYGNHITTNAAYYTRIGNMVYWQLHFRPTFAPNDTSVYQIYGLPFTSKNVTENYGWTGNIVYTASANNSNIANMRPLVEKNNTYIYFHTVGLGSGNRVDNVLIRVNLVGHDTLMGGFYMAA